MMSSRRLLLSSIHATTTKKSATTATAVFLKPQQQNVLLIPRHTTTTTTTTRFISHFPRHQCHTTTTKLPQRGQRRRGYRDHIAASPHHDIRYYSSTTTTSSTPSSEETVKKNSDPLHVLFCGSDEFSCASLEALYAEHVRNPDLIRSIEVVVRPGKRTGRGYKVIRDPPIRSLAEKLGLQIHERDTFTGWDMPSQTNLIVAVSFGLFVPPRLLRAAKYGGLNLHPSLLPDLRGPAPLQHTLLAGRQLTGITLQTLDHAEFDHGVVLAQTASDPKDPAALHVPPSSSTTVADLLALVTPVAAQMLVNGIRDGLHVPPLLPVPSPSPSHRHDISSSELLHAPKITKQDRQLKSSHFPLPGTIHAVEEQQQHMLARRHAAIGSLWFWLVDRKGKRKRVIVEELRELGMTEGSRETPSSTYQQQKPKPYEILLLDDADESHKPTTLVFWDPRPPYIAPVPPLFDKPRIKDQDQGQVDDDSDGYEEGELRLYNYRLIRMKVEGEAAKPARLALRNFLNEPNEPVA